MSDTSIDRGFTERKCQDRYFIRFCTTRFRNNRSIFKPVSKHPGGGVVGGGKLRIRPTYYYRTTR